MERDYSSKIDIGDKQYGVIAPDGKFYPCGYAGHNRLEDELISIGVIEEAEEGWGKSFEWHGWVKLTGSYMSICEFQFEGEVTEYDYNKKEDIVLKENFITKEQVDTIKKYIESLGRTKLNFNYEWLSLDGFERILEHGSKIQDFVWDNVIDTPDDERKEVDGY